MVAKLKAHGTRILNLTGGEPALHPQLEEIFRIAVETQFRSVNLLSNLFYSSSHQDRVIELAQRYQIGIHTSYDGFGAVADKLRGANDVEATIERAMHKINALRKSDLYPHTPTATVVVSALNIEQLPEIIERLEAFEWNLNIDFYRWSSINHQEKDELKITDKDILLSAIEKIRNAKRIKTPLWYYDGLKRIHRSRMKKQCPYLISPTFGSKFFVHENGDIQTCMPQVLGNILSQDLSDIFASDKWKQMRADFVSCEGCWNSCYTVSSRALSFLHIPTIRQYLTQ